MACTCAGTAPGYPQHEDYCGKPETRECPICSGDLGETDGCPCCGQWNDGFDSDGSTRSAE